MSVDSFKKENQEKYFWDKKCSINLNYKNMDMPVSYNGIYYLISDFDNYEWVSW